MNRWLRWSCLLLLYAPASWAATYALLVGVSGYPNLPESRRLEGPANDVRLMRETLLRAGIPGERIVVLADDSPHSLADPNRTTILRHADALIGRLRRGDWMVLYFSGHGSQQPQLSIGNDYREPDGLDEVFLPLDAARWDERGQRIGNGIVDDEIGALLDRIDARGANAWAIFDTCHAGDMTKSLVLDRRESMARYVSPSELGIPSELLDKARAAAMQTGFSKSLRRVSNDSSLRRPSDTAQRVAFFASQPDEPAYEEHLSGNGVGKERVGVFTFHLVAALSEARGAFGAFAELAEQIRQRYRNEKRPFPTPMFEGRLDRRLPLR